MQVHCVHCGTRIPADDLNLERALARCRSCDSVFSFAAALEKEQPSPRPAARERGGAAPGPLSAPRGVRVEDADGRLRITRRWFTPAAFFLVFFCVAWDGFLVFWYGSALAGQAPWIMIVFPIGHLAVGAGLSYFTLCLFINRTVVEVGDGVLTIRHGPLPWPGRRTLPADEIDQLYCRVRHSHGRDGVSEHFELCAVDRQGVRRKLVSGLSEPEEAQFLEQQIETHLRVRDRAVAGEYRG